MGEGTGISCNFGAKEPELCTQQCHDSGGKKISSSVQIIQEGLILSPMEQRQLQLACDSQKQQIEGFLCFLLCNQDVYHPVLRLVV